jgi:hypothetical protein
VETVDAIRKAQTELARVLQADERMRGSDPATRGWSLANPVRRRSADGSVGGRTLSPAVPAVFRRSPDACGAVECIVRSCGGRSRPRARSPTMSSVSTPGRRQRLGRLSGPGRSILAPRNTTGAANQHMPENPAVRLVHRLAAYTDAIYSVSRGMTVGSRFRTPISPRMTKRTSLFSSSTTPWTAETTRCESSTTGPVVHRPGRSPQNRLSIDKRASSELEGRAPSSRGLAKAVAPCEDHRRVHER